jgi:hypothetical protein
MSDKKCLSILCNSDARSHPMTPRNTSHADEVELGRGHETV